MSIKSKLYINNYNLENQNNFLTYNCRNLLGKVINNSQDIINNRTFLHTPNILDLNLKINYKSNTH